MTSDNSMALLKRCFEDLDLESTPPLRRDVCNPDVLHQRLVGVKNLRTYALALGFERTRTELLEFLTDKITTSLKDPPVRTRNHPTAAAPKPRRRGSGLSML